MKVARHAREDGADSVEARLPSLASPCWRYWDIPFWRSFQKGLGAKRSQPSPALSKIILRRYGNFTLALLCGMEIAPTSASWLWCLPKVCVAFYRTRVEKWRAVCWFASARQILKKVGKLPKSRQFPGNFLAIRQFPGNQATFWQLSTGQPRRNRWTGNFQAIRQLSGNQAISWQFPESLAKTVISGNISQ